MRAQARATVRYVRVSPDADSVADYQGAEYGVIAFEEVTEFLESQFNFMKSRLRAPVDGPHPHVVSTTNANGAGHAWAKRCYVRPKPEYVAEGQRLPLPNGVWSPAGSEADPEPLTRCCFVPATLKDNPKLTDRDPGYLRRLRSLRNRGLHKALEEGDWDAIEAVEVCPVDDLTDGLPACAYAPPMKASPIV